MKRKSRDTKPNYGPLPPRSHADTLDRLRNLAAELHPAELQVAQIVLADPSWVSECAIKALAQRAKVSEPTVMRLCHKLGMDGFLEFKRHLAKDLVIGKLYLSADEVVKNTSAVSIADTILASASQSLREAAAHIDNALLEQAAGLLAKANMVYCFGVGGSSAVLAQEAENRLFRLGVSAQASCDPYRQRMTASIVDKGDILLVISSTGKPSSLVESATLARSNGASVISLTKENSALYEHSDVALLVDIFDDEIFFNLPTRTRYTQLFVLDCLVATVATKLPNAAEKLKSIRATLSTLHGVTRYQPIGD